MSITSKNISSKRNPISGTEGQSQNNIRNIPLHLLQNSQLGGDTIQMGSFEFFKPEDYEYYPHRHAFYEIIYFTRGEGTHVIDFEVYQITPPCIFFLTPGQTHCWYDVSLLEGFFIIFKTDALFCGGGGENLLREMIFTPQVGNNPLLILDENQTASFNWLVQELGTEYACQNQDNSPLIQACLQVMLVKLNRMYGVRQKEIYSKNSITLVKQYSRLVNEHFLRERSVQFYANQIGISPGHLSEIVKEVLDFTPGQLIRSMLILEAKRLLTSTDMTIAQVSDALMFKDPSYFSRYFKRESGATPVAFRQNILKKHHIP